MSDTEGLMRGAAIESLVESLTADELSDVVDDIEALLDAYAGRTLDISPAFESLLLDVLEQTVASAGSQNGRVTT